MSIFISCGEISGDLYTAYFIKALLVERPCLKGQVWGMLGPLGNAAGGELVWSYEELKLMGITEVLPAIPRILKLRGTMTREILKRNPAVVIVVDSPDFHFSLVKHLRKKGYGGRVVFLVTPSVWAWRSGRTRTLRKFFDLCLPLFAFENEFLLARGVCSRWRSHPLVETMTGYTASEEIQKRYGDARVIALLPGSRRYDIKFHLTQLLLVAELLRAKGFLPVFSIAPGLSASLKQELRERAAGFETWEGEGRDLMAVSLAVVGVSGTVAIEAMLLRRFMVVIYNGRGLSWLLARLLVRIPYISIPNYLTDRPVYPELLKDEVQPTRILKELLLYLDDPVLKAETDRRMEQARGAMGTESAGVFWARSVLDLAKL